MALLLGVQLPAAGLEGDGDRGSPTDLGIEEVVLQLPSAPRDEVLRTLDDFAQYL
ncbi:hypothetical protein [Streptomyces virginiae]|uniref:hypothetical protein n=1 Tax=Streptomyces virginiae TaxID=1961 RepID=UPI0036F99EE7